MTERVYDEIWHRKLAGAAEDRPVDRWIVTAHEFQPVTRMLDVGCGDGTAARYLGGKAGVIVGTDIAAQACRVADGHGMRTAVSSLDGACLPFATASFDAVTCLDVIEHLLDPAHVMRELSRVLRPGGRCYVSTVNIRYAKFTWQLVFNGFFPWTSSDREAYDGGHLHYFAARNLAELGRAAGLRVVRHVGVVPSAGRLRRLQPLRRTKLVREFLAAGFLLIFERIGSEVE